MVFLFAACSPSRRDPSAHRRGETLWFAFKAALSLILKPWSRMQFGANFLPGWQATVTKDGLRRWTWAEKHLKLRSIAVSPVKLPAEPQLWTLCTSGWSLRRRVAAAAMAVQIFHLMGAKQWKVVLHLLMKMVSLFCNYIIFAVFSVPSKGNCLLLKNTIFILGNLKRKIQFLQMNFGFAKIGPYNNWIKVGNHKLFLSTKDSPPPRSHMQKRKRRRRRRLTQG